MKLSTLFFVSIFAVACSSNNSNSQTGVLSTAVFQQKLSLPKIQVLDVRTAEEYQAGHIKNALQANWLDKAQFADRIQYLDKTIPVLVYCASGVRSGQAMKAMSQEGFKEVYNMEGGMSAWKVEGKPFEAAAATAEMTVNAFQAKLSEASIALVDIGAEWCPPCKKMEPVLAQLQKELGNKYALIKVDGGNDITVMKYLQFQALPTFIVFKNGKETWRKQGLVSLDELKKAINP
ncbi:MAG: rhodanese-like domain-containing protein [Sphingobacteriia bacterium]|jgi:rhodanese-related sulfurtransferase